MAVETLYTLSSMTEKWMLVYIKPKLVKFRETVKEKIFLRMLTECTLLILLFFDNLKKSTLSLNYITT